RGDVVGSTFIALSCFKSGKQISLPFFFLSCGRHCTRFFQRSKKATSWRFRLFTESELNETMFRLTPNVRWRDEADVPRTSSHPALSKSRLFSPNALRRSLEL